MLPAVGSAIYDDLLLDRPGDIPLIPKEVSPCVIQFTGDLVLQSRAANQIRSSHTRGAFRDYRYRPENIGYARKMVGPCFLIPQEKPV